MATVITADIYRSMGLNDFEYDRILELMGRPPTLTELGMFAVMWSEHCGYKYSRPVLAYFKKYREALEGKGLENAGVVDLGDGLGVTMKIESHNHPSAVEPYQGAATGVGGIIRDILTMGARPVALLNSLRFGPLDGDDPVAARNRHLFAHVVEGIGGYGNCVGVPTVAGEVGFHPRYSGNPLVNAMCVGILRLEELTTAAASGDGNPVLYLGSATGKDGIHGATFASEGLDEDSDAKRPNVQIGDPFAEKILIEATLEALQTGAVVAIQDMGAAGLTCSTIEMAAKGGVGMDIDLDLVPMREDDMSAYELMLSESQERMLAVVEKGREEEILAIARKWGLTAAIIGTVTSESVTRVKRHGRVEADLQPEHLADMCPSYTVEPEVPDYYREALTFDPATLPEIDPSAALLKLLASPNLASKEWVYRQYDYQVQTQSRMIPGAADAAVIAPRGTQKGLSLKVDGNARLVFWDPYVGGQLVVAEAARNVACTGAKPVALTDGLNYGNPQRPHVYWQFRESVRGIAEAAEILQTPVISGNVSFYNESELGEVLPTPMIGMLGVLDRAEDAIGMAIRPGDMIALVSLPGLAHRQLGIGASEYLSVVHGIENGVPVATDLEAERRLCHLLSTWVSSGQIRAAHDASEGGLGVALAEMAIAGHCGVEIQLQPEGRLDFFWFAEIPGRVFIAFCGDKWADLSEDCVKSGLKLSLVGVASSEPRVFGSGLDVTVDELRRVYDEALPSRMASMS